MKAQWIVTIISLFLLPALVLGAPESFIDEEINAEFHTNGTLKSQPQRIGYVSVSVGNAFDVLQYVEVNLSENSETNLYPIPGTTDVRAYRATLASPSGNDKVRLYLNTTNGSKVLYYTFNDDVGPLINLSLTYENEGGGEDIHHGKNVFNFTVNIVSSSSLSYVTFLFEGERNTYDLNDALNIINYTSSSGSISEVNRDGDSFIEGIQWSGPLTGNQSVWINFEAEITPGINFDNSSFTYLNLAGESYANYSQPQTFTGITFKNRFSRGPVRQGIEIAKKATSWNVRGFIQNKARGLNYSITKWAIYEVGNDTPVASSSVYQLLAPEDVFYTPSYETKNNSYFSSYFEWNVVWGFSYYSGKTKSLIELPTLYLIDSYPEKIVSIVKNDESGRIIAVNDSVTHIGASEVNVTLVEINSTIPHVSQGGRATSWSISDVRVYVRSGGNEIEVTSNSTISVKNPTSTSDGFVNVLINSTNLGKEIRAGDEIILSYRLSGPSEDLTEKYTFSSLTLLLTKSGTPEMKSVKKTVTLPGIKPSTAPSGGGGGGGPDDVWITTEYSESYLILGNLAHVKTIYKVYDTDGKGLREVKASVFIPYDGKLVKERFSVEVFKNEEWKRMVENKDYRISYAGNVVIGNEKYYQYNIEFNNLTLFNQEKLKIAYNTNLPYGLNDVVTKVSGYNYYRDKIISEETHLLIRVNAKLTKFRYIERDWEQGEAEVGKPVRWLKEIYVKNPNNVAAEETHVVSVFKDTLSAYVIDGGKTQKVDILPDNKIAFEIRLGPQEEKTFYIQIFTPPALETLKDLMPIFSNKTLVVFDMNSTVKNFAEEDYYKVVYTLPCSIENLIFYENIEGVESRDNQTALLLGKLKASEQKSFYVRYSQKPPILMVTTNDRNFTSSDTLKINIVIIPAEREERGYLEIEIIDMERCKTVYGDIVPVEGKAGSVNKFEKLINLKNFQPGHYKVKIKFKKDFVEILSKEKEFSVSGRNAVEISYEVLLLFLLTFVLFSFSRIRKRKDKFKEELERLRKTFKKNFK